MYVRHHLTPDGRRLGGPGMTSSTLRFDHLQHGEERDDGLAAADIALEDTQHAHRRCHVRGDLGQRRFL